VLQKVGQESAQVIGSDREQIRGAAEERGEHPHRFEVRADHLVGRVLGAERVFPLAEH
jgi:hypothetical protein